VCDEKAECRLATSVKPGIFRRNDLSGSRLAAKEFLVEAKKDGPTNPALGIGDRPRTGREGAQCRDRL